MKKFLLTCLLAAATLAVQAALPRAYIADPLRFAKPATTPQWLNAPSALETGNIAPDQSFPTEELLFLDAPDGSIWYAKRTTEFEEVELPGGIATEKHITAYTYTIYNSAFEEVGSVHDQIRMEEGETRVAQLMLGSNITKKFFNSNDNYEIIVTLVLNKTDTGTYPPLNIRSYAYSIGGNKTEEGNDEIVATIPGYPVDYVNTATDEWSENYFVSFYDQTSGNADDYEDYLDFLASIHSNVTTYKKAGWSGGPVAINTVTVCDLNLPGDAANSPFFISCIKDGKFTIISSQYEKSFFVDPTGMGQNEDMTPDNKLIVKVSQLESAWASEMTEIASLSIPTTKSAGDKVLYTFYSIGNLLYDNDVDFTHYTTDGSPAFIITAADYRTDNDDDTIESYYVYGADGTKLLTIAENTENCVVMNDIEGLEPQVMFIYQEEDSYTYDFIDIYSGVTAMTIPAQLDGKVVTTAIERVKTAKGVLYATSLNSAYVDDNGDVWHEVGWINQEGTFDHIDSIKLGKNVSLGQVYIDRDVLNPYLFNTDAAQEYMFLVKRQLSEGSSEVREELLVVAPNADPIMTVLPDETKGNLLSVGIVPGDNPMMFVSFRDDYFNITADYYKLPLTKFAGGDGTAENPYQIATVGDLQQIKSAPDASYVIVSDINAAGFDFKPIENFNGTLDGAGKTVTDLTVCGNAIFMNTGANAVIKDINFMTPTLALDHASYTRSGLIAGNMLGSTVSGINIYGLKAASSQFDDTFGGIAGSAALNSVVSLCNVAGADINIPAATAGGIVGDILTGSSVKACAFTGKIAAASDAGGIASSLCSDGTIADCHVDADITAEHTIGGVVANSARGTVTRNHVEGAIVATGATMWSGYCVGGIVGSLNGDYEATGKIVVNANFVGLDAITIDPEAVGEPSYPGQYDTAHRIVGWSNANSEPEITGYDENYNPIYGDSATPEAGIKDNYVLTQLSAVNPEIQALNTTTEGEDKSRWDIEIEFMETLGFLYGTDAANPWNSAAIANPKLYFEKCAVMISNTIDTCVGETFNVLVRMLTREQQTAEEVFGNLMTSYDESMLEMTGAGTFEDNVLSIEVKALKEGTTDFVVTLDGDNLTATVNIAVSGIEIPVATSDVAVRYSGDVVTASGCAIEIYSLAGVKVAAGNDTVGTTGLSAGIYLVRAVNGTHSATIKIAVR